MPKGFAEIEEPAYGYEWQAVSPEGVIVALRRCEISEGTNLDFCTAATIHELTNRRQYVLKEESGFKTKKGLVGRRLLFEYDLEGVRHLYIVALVTDDDQLSLIETCGEQNVVNKHLQSLYDVLPTLR
ncbi:MAG: hypothetical protein N2234_05470 [Planctomycetota bacterium]|nr:hypothetical protein [Planctomycetota bacterium]